MRTGGSKPLAVSWWEKAVSSQTVFKKAADLAVLRSLRQVAEKTLKRTPAENEIADHQEELQNLLKADKSWPAQWAVGRQSLFTMNSKAALERYAALIYLDIYDSYQNGRPLVPTWSKPYCIDPDTKTPIDVKVKSNTLSMDVKSPAGSWTHQIRL